MHALRTAAALAWLLAGCNGPPTAPLVQVVRGSGVSFGMFQQDDRACRDFAAAQLAAPAPRGLQTVVGAPEAGSLGLRQGSPIGTGTGEIGAVTASNAFMADQQSAPQARYDNAYSLCMYARGNEVPGYGPLAVLEPATAASSGLVQAIQVELTRLQYLRGLTNGVLGPRTVAAITYFERANGLPADGQPSEALLRRLRGLP